MVDRQHSGKTLSCTVSTDRPSFTLSTDRLLLVKGINTHTHSCTVSTDRPAFTLSTDRLLLVKGTDTLTHVQCRLTDLHSL